MKFKNTISWKISFFSILFLILITFVLSAIFEESQERILHENLLQEAETFAEIMEASASEYIDDTKISTLREHLTFIQRNEKIAYTYVLNNKGEVITDGSFQNFLRYQRVGDEFLNDMLNSTGLLIQENDAFVDISMPIYAGSKHEGFIKLGITNAEIHENISYLRKKIFLIGTIVSLVGSVIIFLFVRTQTMPIKVFIEKIKKLAEGNLDQHVYVHTHDELKELSDSFNNMTEKLKEARESLLKAIDVAEKANDLKTEFLAQMSHEIRSPINTILSFTTLIKDDLIDQNRTEYQEYFEAVKNAGIRITRTIDMVLNMAEIQSGSYETKYDEFNLVNEVLESLVLEYQKIAAAKEIELLLRNNSEKPVIYADIYMVTQIFQNLIDNSIKYTPKGIVRVEIDEMEKGNLSVGVTDSGIGISEEFLENLFDPFRQEEQGYTRRYEGSGLGLALVKKYCDLNNAEISVTSVKGRGSTFTVIFKWRSTPRTYS